MVLWRERRHGSPATWWHAFRGGSAAVAEKNDNRRSKRARVLRAADVIPPFNQDVARANESEDGSKESALEPSPLQQPKRERRDRRSQEAGAKARGIGPGEPPAAAVEIPTFDLADNVLAGHRQLAARRRKAPGQVQTEPEIRTERRAMAHVVGPPAQDPRDVQRVVVEIVARDIQRLCGRPGRPPRG